MNERELRLLHVIHDMSPAGGGPPENLLQLAKGYREVGVQPEVLSLDAPGAGYLSRYSFPIHPLGPSTSSFGYSPAMRNWLDRHGRDYDALIVDGLWSYPGVAVRAGRASYAWQGCNQSLRWTVRAGEWGRSNG